MRREAIERLGISVLGIVLAWGSVASTATPPARSDAQIVYSNQRAFRIPFNISAADRPRYKQVQLWVSADGGEHWEGIDTAAVDTVTPEGQPFKFRTFRAPRDGEFWFAVRTLDNRNRLFPADDADIEPNLKVIVDTVAPAINLDAGPRRGSLASVRWEVIEDRLNLESFRLEYQVIGSPGWSRVEIRKPARIGRASWDAGTAEPLKVRMSVTDRAGNSKSVMVNLADGVPTSGPTGSADSDQPPPRSTFASSETGRSGPTPILSGPPPMPGVGDGPDLPRSDPTNVGTFNPFGSGETTPDPSTPKSASDSANPPILVASPRFSLRYEVDDAGPNGPAAVELFVTTDGGQTWFSRGEDTDRTSPFTVDLGGEGTFGLKLVARSAANQGDQPPQAGEPPRTVVQVDSTGPVVKLESVQISGTRAIISWQANDPHPTPRPVMISVRSDNPDSKWVPITPAPIENTGQFTWALPANCPPRIHFRVDVVDALGNRGSAESTETGAILVDRTKPKGRIIGLDPSQRDTNGPSARPIR